jgi:hypothetical protein
MSNSTTLPAGKIWYLDPGPLRLLVDQFTDHLVNCPATIRVDVSDNQDGCRSGVRAKVGRSPAVG